MFSEARIKSIVEKALPEAKIEVLDLVGDQNHFEAKITAPQFEGKSKLEQHRMVNELFKPFLDSGELHALSLKTYTP